MPDHSSRQLPVRPATAAHSSYHPLGGNDMQYQMNANNVSGHNTSQKFDVSVPPHMRKRNESGSLASAGSSVPPRTSVASHWRGNTSSVATNLRNGTSNGRASTDSTEQLSSENGPLATDGTVDTRINNRFFKQTPPVGGTELTPPSSPIVTAREEALGQSVEKVVEDVGLTPVTKWQPHFITTLAPLRSDNAGRIPKFSAMKSFCPDFLRNEFGGSEWSPGLMFVPPRPGYFILPNRCYYAVEADLDPFLPSVPGAHGAKLVPFFNCAPEEEYDCNFTQDTGTSSENVALFILRPDPAHANRKRYFYFGHYTQSRWSDKLDYDRMLQCVPQHVREYWADELSAVRRPEWLSKQLLQHFFPKPLYEGRMPGVLDTEGGSVASEDMGVREEKVSKDIEKYLEELRTWEKEYRMKTSLIGKDFILQAFDRADADEHPPLRLYWEYLECVDWKPDFYETISILQGREPMYDRY